MKLLRTFRDADCRTAYCVAGPPEVARRVLADAADEALVFVDPDGALVQSLGLERLPAFVHLRQDTTLVAAAEGWDPREWQRVAREVGKAMAWTVPEVTGPGDPAPTMARSRATPRSPRTGRGPGGGRRDGPPDRSGSPDRLTGPMPSADQQVRAGWRQVSASV